jgi:hypothetical protein
MEEMGFYLLRILGCFLYLREEGDFGEELQ